VGGTKCFFSTFSLSRDAMTAHGARASLEVKAALPCGPVLIELLAGSGDVASTPVVDCFSSAAA
jgi:hypothetical protein